MNKNKNSRSRIDVNVHIEGVRDMMEDVATMKVMLITLLGTLCGKSTVMASDPFHDKDLNDYTQCVFEKVRDLCHKKN